MVGVAYATQLVVRKAWQLLSGFRAYFLAPRGLAGVDLKRYGPWAGRLAVVSRSQTDIIANGT